MTQQLKFIGQLLTPSWLSGLLAVTAGVIVVAGAAIMLHYNGSSIQLLRELQADKPAAITESYDTVDSGFSANEIISDIPLLILWGGVGALVYSLITQTIKAFTRAVDLHNELNYVHANRQQLIHDALLRFAARAVILIVWLLYIQFTIHILVPYVIALVYAGSGAAGWLADTGYLLFAVCLITVGIHLHTVMLRLIMLRTRVFGTVA